MICPIKLKLNGGNTMYELRLRYQEHDQEFEKALDEAFPDFHIIQSEKNFDGLDIFITVGIPIASLSIQIIDFVFNHLVSRKDKSKSEKTHKRALVTNEGDLYLDGYEKDKVRDVLIAYLNEQGRN